MTGRDEYFKISKNVGAKVDCCLEEYLKKNIAGKEKQILYDAVLKKKIGTQKLRANILYLSYCTFANKDPEDDNSFSKNIISLCTATELMIWSQYMVNWIYDSKANIIDNTIRKKTAVSANGLLSDAITLAMNTGAEYVLPMLTINDYVIASFTPEINGMNIANKKLLENREEYFSIYNNNYAIPGVGKFFEGLVEMGATMAKYENHTKIELFAKIFCEFGRDHETLNALGDFVIDTDLTHEKSPIDQYSDIKNNTLTPPIWHLYNNSSDTDKEILLTKAGMPLNLEEKKYFLKQLFNTGTYNYLVKRLKHQGRAYKKQVSNLEFPKKASNAICQLLSVYESNKIYHQLKDDYKNI